VTKERSMTTYLRKHATGDPEQIDIDTESWDLDVQLERLHAWMREHPDFTRRVMGWIVDIGYEPRANVAVARYTISVQLMTILANKNVTLWLSDYLNEKQARPQH
jgi:hypothetical protein